MVFEKIFYMGIIVILILFSLSSFILNHQLNKDFFIRFSADKELTDQTISKVTNLQSNLLILGSIFLILTILFIYFKRYVRIFIKIHKDFFQNFLLFAGTIIFLILIGEITCRIMFYKETSNAGFGPGSIKFNSEYVELNKEGMRDGEFDINKPKDTIRIVGIGDSFTFGAGIENVNDTYLKVLETKLNKEKGKYEVLNFGKSGLDLEKELEILKRDGLKYNPDIVIVGYVLNDFKNVDENIKRENIDDLTIPYIGFWLRNFSYLYYFLETRVNRMLVNRGYRISYEDSLIGVFDSEINKEYNKQIFKELESISKERDMDVLIVIFPMLYKFEEYPFLSAYEFITKTGNENKFYTVDLLEAYRDYNDTELIVNKYDRHPNEIAHRLAGEAIFEKLINEKIPKSIDGG